MLVKISQQWDYAFFLVLPWQPANYMTCQWTVCLYSCVSFTEWTNVCARVYTPSHLSTPSSICLFHFLRQFVAAFGLPEDYAIGRPFLMPRHTAVHSSAPQGMFTFQKLSMWTSSEREKVVLRLVKGTECDCYANVSSVETTETFIDDQIQLRVEQSTTAKFTMTTFSFFTSETRRQQDTCLCSPMFLWTGFVFWVPWLHLL